MNIFGVFYPISQMYVCKEYEYGLFLPTIFVSLDSFNRYCLDNNYLLRLSSVIPLADYLVQNPKLSVYDIEVYYNEAIPSVW